MRRILSMTLALAMIFGAIPFGELLAWADGEVKLNEIFITKYIHDFKNENEAYYSIRIRGTNLRNINVGVMNKETGKSDLGERDPNNAGQFSLAVSEAHESEIIVFNNNEELGSIKLKLPSIDNIEPDGGVVNTSEKDSKDKVKIYISDDAGVTTPHLSQGTSKIDLKKEENENYYKPNSDIGDKIGSWGVFYSIPRAWNNELGVNTNVSIEYLNVLSLRKNFNIEGDISIFPTQGPVGTTATITADKIDSPVSVFLMNRSETEGKEEKYKYTKDNMVDNTTIKQVGGKLVFDIPNIALGLYDIVLTNRIDPSKDIDEQIIKYKVLGNDKNKLDFLVTDGDGRIDTSNLKISPDEGDPKGGDNATIGAKDKNSIANIIKVISDLYDGGVLKEDNFTEDNKDKGVKELILIYEDGKYDGEAVERLTRKITVQIGTFADIVGYSTDKNSNSDELKIRTPEYNSGEYKKDVILTINNEIEFKGDTKPQSWTEGGIISNQFEYKKIDFEPSIDTINPNKIPVNQEGKVIFNDSDDEEDGIMITITSKEDSFLKYGYKDNNGNIASKMPVVSIDKEDGSEEWFKNDEIKIYNKNGEELKSKEGNQFGSIIKIKLKKGETVGKGIFNLKVNNPLANEEEGFGKTFALGEIEFVEVTSKDILQINEIVTQAGSSKKTGEAVVSVDGEKGVKIIGSGFDNKKENITLYLDGKDIEIGEIVPDGSGSGNYTIVFDAPKKPIGKYQIIVQNADGRMAIFDNFSYIESGENIKITDFNPKKGKADTLVTVEGENFLRPNPLTADTSGINIYRLIGTRVLLGNRDANDYNMKNGKISLEKFESNEDIIKSEKGQVKLSDYYHSVILEDKDGGKYYTIYNNPRTGNVELGDGDKTTYILEAKDDRIIATKGGVVVDDFKVNEGNIVVDDKTLMFKTPYKAEGGKIVGNRVKVLDSGELIFRVPPMDREGYYDLTVINPDTKKDSKIGEKGFYYSYQADPSPKIDSIEPKAGSVDGGYYITISGSGFEDNGGNNKTSVTIGKTAVDPKDVEVSTDGKSLKVKVPKYPGNLAEETDMDRKTVAVVVVNPNGGSDSVEEGFSYIIPISHPKIDRLILNRGSAAGGETVIIEGSEFRFFEPYKDENNNSKWDEDEDGHEPFTDINENKTWDDLRYWLSNEHKEAYDDLAEDYETNIRPILPKVYFGKKEVKIIDFTASTIEVETPKGVDGPVEVYVVNNDHGRSNKLTYTYTASNPRITNITPNKGRRQGKDKVEILGEGFGTSGVLVQFGSLTDRNISNSSIGINEPENSGRIRDRKSKVTLNDLIVEYDASKDQKTLKFTAEILDKGNKIIYGPVIKDYKDGEFFFDVEELKNSEGDSYPGYEKVRVTMERIEGAQNTSRLRVDRGFAPEVVSNSQRQVSVKTPSYYRTGKDVPVTLINPDGGDATTNFEYLNPDSNPVITDLQEDGVSGYEIDGRYILELPYTGGKYVEVIGKDFRKPVSLKLVPRSHKEGMSTEILIPQENIEYDPKNEDVVGRLIVKIPEITNEKDIGEEFKIELTNNDGASANSDPRYIKFTRPESMDLEITKVTPNFGPTAGGTTITIEGKGFRETMDKTDRKLKVYFGKGSNRVEVPESDIMSVTHNKIVLKTPSYTAGLADMTVENPDRHEKTLVDGFNYVSSPRIISVVDPDNDKFIIETLSVEGGQKIKILGNDFMEGARVVFNPVLELVENESQATGDIITIDDKKYILKSGIPGTEVERIDGQTITVTTPAGKLGDKGVIVINPDQGATNVYNIVYGIPEIASPFDVKAEIVFDQFIRVNWTGPKEAVEYEIYMSEEGGKFEFIGTTELTSYAVQKLKPNTKYQFLLKAMGKYGASKPIDEAKSNIVTTGKEIGPVDESGKTGEKTQITINGTNADIILGSKDFTSKGMIFDLTRGDLGGVKDITIRMPANVITSSLGRIQVIGKDYKIDFAPKIFKTSAIEDNKTKSNAGVVFKIASHNDNMDIKPGTTVAGGKYKLEAVTYVDKGLSKMDHLNGKLNFTLNQNALIIKNRKLKTVKTVRYDDNSKTWVDGNIANRLGLYTVMGSRR